MKTYTFYVSGTHCASCKILIEDTLNDQPGITHVQVDLKKETVSLDTVREDDQEMLAATLTEKIRENGYALSVEKKGAEKKEDSISWLAVCVGLCVLIIFFLLQKSGILNIGFGGQVTPTTSFIIGLIASVSSCLAIVGGLVLSLSAKILQDDKPDTRTFILFHAGRLVSFALLGGVLGVIGHAVGINITFTAVLGLLASMVMIMLGLNLVGVVKKNKFVFSGGLFQFFKGAEYTRFGPLILGFATFFLPCGFTQSMQIAAVSSGSFFSGLMIMLAFALGTLPMLGFLSFGSASLARGKYAPLFFQSAGIVVIGLGAFAFLSGLAGLGVINPIVNI